MKNYTKLIFLFIGIYAIGIFILGLVVYAIFPQFFPITTYGLIALFLFLAFLEVKASVLQVYNPYVLILEKYSWSGKERIDVEILKPGFHFVFQRFGIYKINSRNEQGFIVEEIFPDDHTIPIETTVAFKDVIGGVRAELTIRIVDVISYAYKHKTTRNEIATGIEASLRHFFSHYEIDNANEKRGMVNLNVIFRYYDEENDIGKSNWIDTEFGKRLMDYGCYPVALKIVSIQYPEKSKKAKEAPYIAGEGAKAALIRAEAAKKSRVLEGKGEGAFIEDINNAVKKSLDSLIKVGLTPTDARFLLQSNAYHEALKAANNVVAVSGSGSTVTGAEIAAGMSAFNENKKKGDES